MNINMKIQSHFLMFLLTFFISFAAIAQEKDYVVNGLLTNFSPMPEKVYMVVNLPGESTERKVDSAVVSHGKYSFKGSSDVSVTVNIAVKKAEMNTDFFALMLDNGALDLVSTDDIRNTTVSGTGSAAHKELMDVTSFTKKESLELNRLAALDEYKTNDSLKKVLQQRATNVFGNALVNMINYVRKNPESSISPFLTYTLVNSGFVTPEMTDTLVKALPEKIKATSIGKALNLVAAKRADDAQKQEAKRKELENKIPLGSNAIAFTMNDVNGKPVSLDSYKGKYVLIDFWASWCKPCREENPNLVKAYEKYKSKGFNVLGVSIDGASQKAAWIAAIQKDGLSWTQVSDLKGAANEAAVLYGVESIPQNFLVDPNGKIIARNLRGAGLNEKLAEVFK
jgi:peroxiredoxin